MSQGSRMEMRKVHPELQSEMDMQRSLLNTILAQAKGTLLYQGKLRSDLTLDNLSIVPVTHYSTIKEAVDRVGWDGILLRPADYLVETSGSTGDPKRIPYSSADFDDLAEGYALLMHQVGVRPQDVGWNIGGAYPLISGPLVEVAAAKIPLERAVSTTLTRDTDLIKALKRVCTVDRIDGTAGATLIYYVIARICNDPTYLEELVRSKLKRDYHLPTPLSSIVTRLWLRGLNLEKLRKLAAGVRIGMSYAESVTVYLDEIRKAFPGLRLVDVFGSTEIPLIAAQLDPSTEGLCLYTNAFIAEIARPEDVQSSKDEVMHLVPGVPWWRWETGMTGELLISRPGECLPLIRYATGDMIEVLDPNYETDFVIDGTQITTRAPLIKVLGRAVDVLDYEVEDESGNLLGNKVYSRQINDALQGAQNVRWWEVFMAEGTPARMIFVVIPEERPDNPEAFRHHLIHRLMSEIDDPLHTIQLGDALGCFTLVVAPPEAYSVIQSEINRRIGDGRPIGQLKPKRIHLVAEEQLKDALLQRKVDWH